MSEAELAIEEKLRKKREEQEQAWQEYLTFRAKQRAKEEEELKKLKDRQARRKAQRAEDEKFMLEMRRKQDELRQKELEERKNKEAEAKRLRLEEAEKKRLAMQQAIKQRDDAARRNFIVKKTSPTAALESGPIVFGMQDVMKTKEQLAEDKKIAMNFRIKPLKIEGLASNELKKTVNELWDTIVQLESDKYDLEEEKRRQEYHLKELTERQKQINKNKALKLGLDMEDLCGKHPPKVRLASKYERRIDRRTFGEKTELFDGGYVQTVRKMTDEEWAEKINQFKETHGDKHVPKWDPSAPRKDATEPGKKIYEDDSEDEETDVLVDKLKSYMEQQDQADSQSRRSSVAQPAADNRARRRSSQVSNASGGSAAKQPSGRAAPQPAPQQQDEEEEEEEEEEVEEDEEEEEEDEEEYEDEEEEE